MLTSEIIELRSGPLVVAVTPQACGAITRFGVDGRGRTFDLLRPASPDAIAARNPLGMSCFPLVPFSNRIRNGRFTFEGRTIALPPNFPPEPHNIHGQGWRASWTAVERAGASLAIEYRHAPDAWPFAYRARQHYDLREDRLEVTLTVTNEGVDAMPVGVGLHPYFVRTPRARLWAQVRQFWKTDDDAMPTELVPVPDTIPLTGAGINPDAIALDTNFLGFGGTADIEWPEHDARLHLATRGPFTCFVVYTPPSQPFFCAEPATNCIDAFNLAAAGRNDTGMLVLPPGDTLDATVSFTPTIGDGTPKAG
jgi:aldose 1-epimerase